MSHMQDIMDECFFPTDYATEGDEIRDDVFTEKLVTFLPAGVQLHALFDCCHSGSMLDLALIYETNAGGQVSISDLLTCRVDLAGQCPAGPAYVDTCTHTLFTEQPKNMSKYNNIMSAWPQVLF